MFKLKVNGKVHQVDSSPETPLLWVLRDDLGFTSVKYGCGIGECGSCTVLINGKAERSCSITAESAQGLEITTIEGLPEDHPVKRAWIAEQVPQCGYCQPGMILQAVDVIKSNPKASKREMAQAMDDVMCRCGTHARVLKAMSIAAGKMGDKGGAT
ncbi:(2Fe-2S)-binding protein [Dethiosulfatarculus sandiegensis]|uniref:(2Fe-2S)-binding protein n=1 Tax=Dethiosulfatarculus sandiegensis TaxID=1429043 RepID=A0A0D2JB74_9BACT|nr:(2Fe-2S)-binding protein [Dethiosulfatarculus sandiegensis]KIX12961.1 (2Fe-2S)-binding protein [Dethiosulfatarculus sandiegensis]